jgi:hypothetical protein
VRAPIKFKSFQPLAVARAPEKKRVFKINFSPSRHGNEVNCNFSQKQNKWLPSALVHRFSNTDFPTLYQYNLKETMSFG